jgi:hypothetical protein
VDFSGFRSKVLFSVTAVVLFQLVGAVSLASDFDSDDRANLGIYTRQGYYINTDLRSQIPLSSVTSLLDQKASPTCASLQSAKAPYLSKIMITPYKKMKPADYKLFSLIEDALIARGQPTARTVFRGAHSCDFLMNPSGQPVKYFLEKAFMSTSEREEVAQRFTVSMNMMEDEKEPTGCLMKIESLSGVPIAQATGNFNGEEEILFPSGSLFEVTSFQMSGKQKVFTLKEIAKKDPAFATITSDLLNQEAKQKISELYPELAAGKVGASKQFNADAEYACHEAYVFFTTNPAVRKSVSASKPQYDLTNKKLNADNYIVEE